MGNLKENAAVLQLVAMTIWSWLAWKTMNRPEICIPFRPSEAELFALVGIDQIGSSLIAQGLNTVKNGLKIWRKNYKNVLLLSSKD